MRGTKRTGEGTQNKKNIKKMLRILVYVIVYTGTVHLCNLYVCCYYIIRTGVAKGKT